MGRNSELLNMKILRMMSVLLALPMIGIAATPKVRAAAGPTINTVTISPIPALVGGQVRFQVDADPVGGGALTYRWLYGDTQDSGFNALNFDISRAYAAAGHYTVTVEVQESGGSADGTSSTTRPLTVTNPLTANKPNNSSTIILDSGVTPRVWVVNPDQDTVTCMSLAPALIAEIPVGQAPRTLAECKVDGRIWVVSQQHPSVSIIHPTTFVLEHVIPLPHGSLPYGIAMSPNGDFAYVTLQGSGGVKKISTATRQVVSTSTLPASARGVSVKSNGNLLVTRFISPQSDPLLSFSVQAFKDGNHGEVVELNANLVFVRTFNLAIDPGPFPSDADPDFGPSGVPPAAIGSRGVPNYLTSLVITPDGKRAWVPSKKDNVQRGRSSIRHAPIAVTTPPGAEVAETTYRAIVSSLDLVNNVEPALVPATQERFDVDNSEMPQAACTSPLGDYLFIALQGNNRVQVRDLIHAPSSPIPFLVNGLGDATGGLAPQGIVYDSVNNVIYVQNYMSRTISKMNAAPILAGNGGVANLGPATTVSTIVGGDKLATLVLQGKQIFYNAADTRMSQQGYISCAGCHLDGGSDARVFDFTGRGEGLRNTVMLQGRGGTGHGNVHWSANFDEIQDFENDIQKFFLGSGFSGGLPNAPLGTPNAGRPSAGAELDQLAAYVASLTKVSRSPFRNSNGTLTATGAAGEAVFKSMNCQQCHNSRNFSDSTVGTSAPVVNPVAPHVGDPPTLHSIGTIKIPTSGQRLGGTLDGIDTPTLKGVWQTAPYLHNGFAATLDAVFSDNLVTAHFVANSTQRFQLAEYVREIDEIDAPPVGAQTNNVTITSVFTGRPYSLGTAESTALPFVDRSYTITGGTLMNVANILVRTAEDDKLIATGSHLTLTFGAGATWTVCVCYDGRGGVVRPDWLNNGFGLSGETVTISSIATPMNVRELTGVTATTLTFGGNLATGATGALRNYFVILKKTGGSEVWEEGPLNKKEWVHDQDADGDGLLDEYEAVNLLSPWVVNTGGGATVDEDKFFVGSTTQFMNQGVPGGSGGGGGGGGGCGLAGFEFLLPLALFRLARRRKA
jgi:DNA-binding beta-propeller fold protein YncE